MKFAVAFSSIVLLSVAACSADGGLEAEPSNARESALASAAGARCNASDRAIVSLSRTTLRSCETSEAAVNQATLAIYEGILQCLKNPVSGEAACDVDAIAAEAAVLATAVPLLQTASCSSATTLRKSVPSPRTKTLRADAIADFDTTCTYAKTLVSVGTSLGRLIEGTNDGGSNGGDRGAPGTVEELRAIIELLEKAKRLAERLPDLNRIVHTDLDAKPCG